MFTAVQAAPGVAPIGAAVGARAGFISRSVGCDEEVGLNGRAVELRCDSGRVGVAVDASKGDFGLGGSLMAGLGSSGALPSEGGCGEGVGRGGSGAFCGADLLRRSRGKEGERERERGRTQKGEIILFYSIIFSIDATYCSDIFGILRDIPHGHGQIIVHLNLQNLGCFYFILFFVLFSVFSDKIVLVLVLASAL